MEIFIDSFAKSISEIERFRIYKWDVKCWKCKKVTPHVSYIIKIKFLGIPFILGRIEKLDKFLEDKYSFVKKIYNYSKGAKVFANVCIHCYIIQGNNFLLDKIRSHNVGLDNLDGFIINTLTNQDLPLSPLIKRFFQI